MKTLNNQDLQSLFKNYEYIFWDYDDTLSPTVIKKGIAYVNIFEDYPQELKDYILKHHKKFPGVSRQIKLPIYLKESLKYKDVNFDSKLIDLKKNFSNECIHILSEIPIFKNIEKFLNKSKKHNYIITNMPQEEINQTIKSKALRELFIQIIGDAIDKTNILQEKLSNINDKEKCVFVGDSKTDYEAAINCNVDFILKSSSYNKSLQSIPKIKII